jgi:hypothetical protein
MGGITKLGKKRQFLCIVGPNGAKILEGSRPGCCVDAVLKVMAGPHASPKELDGVGFAKPNTKDSKTCPLFRGRKRGLFRVGLLEKVFPFGRGNVAFMGRDKLFPEASAVVNSARVRAEKLVARKPLIGIL